MEDGDHEDSELETDFHDLRKRILSFQDTIAVLDARLYSDSVYQFVTRVFNKFASGSLNTWQDMEVALFQLHAFAEPLKRISKCLWWLILGDGSWENSVHLHRFVDMLSQAVNLCMLRCVRLITILASKLPDPTARTLLMEICVRYSAEIQLQSNIIPAILEFFVGPSGIHSAEPRVQFRAWYLFDRFLNKLQKDIVSISEQILTAFGDLLVIRAPVASASAIETPDSDSETESERDVLFDNQLYLFQSAGLLTALSQTSNFELGQALIQALQSTIKDHLTGALPDQQGVHYVHHAIMAIGNVAKGFDGAVEISSITRQQTGTKLFSPAAETVLKALSLYEDSSQIRDAVTLISLFEALTLQTRYAFSRFVAVMGENVLDKVPALIGGLLGKSTTGELIDFLPFLGQLIHKFKVFSFAMILISSRIFTIF